jgi:hypothetical protein
MNRRELFGMAAGEAVCPAALVEPRTVAITISGGFGFSEEFVEQLIAVIREAATERDVIRFADPGN